ncbi:MAG: isochorismatase family protein [Candidatus Woesearchaeota archaeon]|jgi:nicotinamidase-related amidase|nr:isochorismatase family protein [Candidatus Woesearchaeota archaeon]
MLFNKSKLEWVDLRVEQDFQKLFNLTNQGKNFAVVSIDMQNKFLKWIYPSYKQKILFKYHSKIKSLCRVNEIDFLEIEYFGAYRNVLKDKESLVFNKTSDSVAFNSDFMNYLTMNKIRDLYVIGINRNNCVLTSICHLKESGYNIYTSILGTGSNVGDYDSYKKKQDTRTFINGYADFYRENNTSNYTLRNNLDLLLKKGVKILDYNVDKFIGEDEVAA